MFISPEDATSQFAELQEQAITRLADAAKDAREKLNALEAPASSTQSPVITQAMKLVNQWVRELNPDSSQIASTNPTALEPQAFEADIRSAIELSTALRAAKPQQADAVNAIIDNRIGLQVEALGDHLVHQGKWNAERHRAIVENIKTAIGFATNTEAKSDIEVLQATSIFITARDLAFASLPNTTRPTAWGDADILRTAYEVITDAPTNDLGELMERALNPFALRLSYNRWRDRQLSAKDIPAVQEVLDLVRQEVADRIEKFNMGYEVKGDPDFRIIRTLEPIDSQIKLRAALDGLGSQNF